MSSIPLIYAPGTTVILNGAECVVTSVSLTTGHVTYAVDGCAWYEYEQLTFVAHPTPESIERAIAIVCDEEEDYDDDDDDE